MHNLFPRTWSGKTRIFSILVCSMKFHYQLVSNEKDIYYEQTLVSVISLRHHNPEAFISLVVDDKTAAGMTGFRALIKDYVQEFKVIPFEESVSNKVRSRYLKTNMREWIEGDFLFLDGDTAVVGPLNLQVPENWDVASVVDLHARENDAYRMKHKGFRENIRKTGFSIELQDRYYNSGVIFMKDSAAAMAFCNKWHELYKFCTEKGITTDQLSFNETNRLLGFPMKELDGGWNCQVREAYNHLYRVKTIYPILCNARIVHFFGSGIDGRKEPHPLMRKDFFERIKAEQKVSEDVKDIACNARRYFIGAPEVLDPKVKFPKFFIYRQMPTVFKVLSFFKNFFK